MKPFPSSNKQNIDDFINDELQDNGGAPGINSKPSLKPQGIGSKPSFAMGAKKPNAFAKPTFAVGLQKKAAMNDDDIDTELAQIDNRKQFETPGKGDFYQPDPVAESYQDNSAYQPGLVTPNTMDRKIITPNISIKKGPAIFMKPNMATKKKFQMDAPDKAEQDKFDKVIIQQVKAQELRQEISRSALKNQIGDEFTAPQAMVKKTQADLAYVKQNPRPPSVALNKSKKPESEDEYSDDNAGGFEEEGGDDDIKLQQIRRAMQRENTKAQVKAQNGMLSGVKKNSVTKLGPNFQQKGKFQATAAQVAEEEIAEILNSPQKNRQVIQQNEPQQYNQVKKLTVAAPNALPTMKKSLPTVKLQSTLPTMNQPTMNQPTQQQDTFQVQKSQYYQPSDEKPVSYQQQNFDYQEPLKKQAGEAPKNLEGFAKTTVLIAGERVDHLAANNQKVRAAELKELIQLEQEEFFNVFEMVPQTAQDIYFQKLTAGTVKTAIVSCSDNMIERDIQTEDLGAEDKFTQAPEDQMSANPNQQKGSVATRRTKKNEALQLEKFIARAGPVVEQILDENDQLRFMENRSKASKHNAVEAKEKLKFPDEILIMLGGKNQAATLMKVTCIHIFETMPQSKCAVAYEIDSPRHSGSVYVILIFSTTANQVLRILRAESLVTQMCTPQDDQILIVGTEVGSIELFDLTDFESQLKTKFFDPKALLAFQQPDILLEKGELEIQQAVKQVASKYRILSHTFQSDCLPNYSHFSPITRLKFVSKVGSGPAQIGCMDELGVVSSWSVLEIQTHARDRIGDHDLNVNLGGRFKLLENYSENLMFNPDIFDGSRDIAQSIELEFDPSDHNVFYFSSSESLYRCNRRDSNVPVKLDTSGLGSPSAMSMSDTQYLLVGFTCGSIALYHNKYLSPITIWYQACKYPIMQVSWCWLYFNAESALEGALDENRRFMTRMCEFFVIDKSENFYIYNLSKSLNKSAHVINFAEKHQSHPDAYDLYRISNTCADQTFYTSFLLRDNAIQLYMMNFKKGSQITKEKLNLENQKSANLLKTLPLNMDREDNLMDV